MNDRESWKQPRKHNHFAEMHPDEEEVPRRCHGHGNDVLILFCLQVMSFEGYRIGDPGNGVILCGSDVPGRYVAGVRKLHTGEWLTGWHGQEPGVDPAEVARANAHRQTLNCERHTLQNDEAAADLEHIANVGDDDATDIADLATAIGASTAVASSGVDAGEMENHPTTVVARWSKPVELRPCTTLVVQNNVVLPNGRLSLEDTLDDTLDALGLQDELPDTEDFQSCDTDLDDEGRPRSFDQFADADLVGHGEASMLSAPSNGADDRADAAVTELPSSGPPVTMGPVQSAQQQTGGCHCRQFRRRSAAAVDPTTAHPVREGESFLWQIKKGHIKAYMQKDKESRVFCDKIGHAGQWIMGSWPDASRWISIGESVRGPFVHVGSDHDPCLEWFCDSVEHAGLASELAILEQNMLGPHDDRLFRRIFNGAKDTWSYHQGCDADPLGLWLYSEREFELHVLPKFPAGIWEQQTRMVACSDPTKANADGQIEAPYFYCVKTGQQCNWLPKNAVCVLDEFQPFVSPYVDEDVPSRPVSLSDTAGADGGATPPSPDVLALTTSAEASSVEPVAPTVLGPTPEEARLLAEQQRERDFARLNQSERQNCKLLEFDSVPQRQGRN